MRSTIQNIERRLERVEQAIEDIRHALVPQPKEPWWLQTAGMFKDDPVFDQIMEEVRKQRQADYEAVCKEIDEREVKEPRQNGTTTSARKKKHSRTGKSRSG